MSLDKKHEVRVSVQVLDLSKAGSGINLEIYSEGVRLGTMKLGHGSIQWRGASKQKFKRIDWSAFAKMMDKA
jgi:hypothetical protein